jgi:hypothetical protein
MLRRRDRSQLLEQSRKAAVNVNRATRHADDLVNAPTARAARELRDVAGVPSNTMHALSRRLDGRRLRPDTVLLIAEAGMAGTRISADILRHAEHAGVKVIAVATAAS